MWGKAKEESNEDYFDVDRVQPPSNSKTPLLKWCNVIDRGGITHNYIVVHEIVN